MKEDELLGIALHRRVNVPDADASIGARHHKSALGVEVNMRGGLQRRTHGMSRR